MQILMLEHNGWIPNNPNLPVLVYLNAIASQHIDLASQFEAAFSTNGWPSLSVDVTFSDRLIDLIDEGFDLAMRIGPPKEDSRLLTRTVAYQQMITCASPKYLAEHAEPKTPEDLSEHQCLHFVSGGRLLPWNFRVNGRSVPVTHGGRLQMDSAESLHQSAVAGLGIATLPSYVVNDDLRRGKLVQLLAGYAEAAEPIRVIYPSKRHLSPKIRLFIDKLVEAWSPYPPWEQHFAEGIHTA